MKIKSPPKAEADIVNAQVPTVKIEIPIITVDGPSGAGKGTLCTLLAQRYGFSLLDSGALYRVIAVAALKGKLDLADEDSVAKLAVNLDVSFKPMNSSVKVLLAGENVSHEIRTEDAGMGASTVAAHPKVRAALLQRQRDFGQLPGLIADGRDMGTTVFPQAQVKVFLTASAEERAQRRLLQLEQSGTAEAGAVTYEAILSDIKKRDEQDQNRSSSPLVPAQDAIILDSTSLPIDLVFERVCTEIKQQLDI